MKTTRNFVVIIFAGILILSYFLEHFAPLANYKEYIRWIPLSIFILYSCKKIVDAENEFGMIEMELEGFKTDNKELSAINETYAARIAQLENHSRSYKEPLTNDFDYKKAINAAYREAVKSRGGHAPKAPLTDFATSSKFAIKSLVAASYFNGMFDMAAQAVDIASNFTREKGNTLNTQQQIASLLHKKIEELKYDS